MSQKKHAVLIYIVSRYYIERVNDTFKFSNSVRIIEKKRRGFDRTGISVLDYYNIIGNPFEKLHIEYQ
jgi:hypothetical protein